MEGQEGQQGPRMHRRRPGPENGLDLSALGKAVGSTPLWVALALLTVGIFLVATVRVGRVTGEEVGILLNKLNGETTVINESGAKIYNGITHDLYVLDKTMQSLEMTEVANRGDRTGRDDLKVKTIDGSDVYVDIKVQFKLNAEMADTVIATSGPGRAYKTKWARDYVRSLCRDYFGELSTEEFYDSPKRNAKVVLAQQEVNRRLAPFGIEVDSIVVPRKPHFYKEYEAKIKQKKLADQAVLEERSKALAAKERQQFLMVEETNKKKVAIKGFEGKMQQKIIQVEAEADQGKRRADAYFDEITIGAQAELYQKKKAATGVLAKKKAEAEGIKALKKALEGEGGRNMVKMEYARKLKDVTITGKPYVIESRTERFEHTAPAAGVGRSGKR